MISLFLYTDKEQYNYITYLYTSESFPFLSQRVKIFSLRMVLL